MSNEDATSTCFGYIQNIVKMPIINTQTSEKTLNHLQDHTKICNDDKLLNFVVCNASASAVLADVKVIMG